MSGSARIRVAQGVKNLDARIGGKEMRHGQKLKENHQQFTSFDSTSIC